MTTTTDIVAKLWNLCHVLRDDGITYHWCGCSWRHQGSQTCQLVNFRSQEADADGLVQVPGRSGAFFRDVDVFVEARGPVRPRWVRAARDDLGRPVAGMNHLSEWTAARMAVMASGF